MRVRFVLLLTALFLMGANSMAVAKPLSSSDPNMERALVRLVDLGPSWTQRLVTADDPDQSAKTFCGVRLATPLSTKWARFTTRGAMVDSYVIRYRSGEAKRIIGSIRAALAKGCTVEQDSGLEDEPALTSTYQPRKVPRLANESVGFQTVPGSLFAVSVIMFRKGDTFAMISHSTVGPPSKFDLDRIATVVTGRL